MAKKDKKERDMSKNEKPLNDELPSDHDEGDPDFQEEPAQTADIDQDEEEFEFDSNLMLKGIELEDLTPDFVRPEGFLLVPRLNKKTGEISPPETTFAGILNDIVPWKDNRGKERYWFSCTATSDIPETFYTGRNDEGKAFIRPLKKGERVGISCSGAINALRTKKGHFVLLHWTGAKITVKNGDMWQIIAKVSKKPVEKTPF